MDEGGEVKRYYYRCPICLSVQALELEDLIKVKCSICNVEMKSMGFVHEDSLVEVQLRSPCDLRCTQAFGPKCDCKCQGKNHGSHLIVKVLQVIGGIPIIPISDPLAYFRRKEYLFVLEEAKIRLSLKSQKISSDRPWELNSLGQQFKNAIGMESHKPRIKKLNSLFI